MNQKYSSANTSVNKSSPAAIWGKINFSFINSLCINAVIDYGCGRYWRNTRKLCEERGTNPYCPYDPYWLAPGQNQIAKDYLRTKDTACICANVLNVIQEDDIVDDIISEITSNFIWAIQIYEGNKSGIGKQTKNDCYQRNQKVKDYLPFFHKRGISVYVSGNIITNTLSILK